MRVIDLISARHDIADDEIVAALVETGVGGLDAELLVRFVPCALTFALLKLMGLNNFPSTYGVFNASGVQVELPLAKEHYFTTALSVGYEVTTHGYTPQISKETFQAVIQRSAEMNALNKFFEAGHTIEELKRSSIAAPILIGLTAERIAASR
ncbi:MAG TPA: hypothetical protein VGZ25_01340 [Gemmataceae bacterium]|nr:hypothetical protein [Gemmataceae bacterium]